MGVWVGVDVEVGRGVEVGLGVQVGVAVQVGGGFSPDRRIGRSVAEGSTVSVKVGAPVDMGDC